MAIHSTKTVWRENNIFDTDIDGHTVTIDIPSAENKMGVAPTPKKLLLVSAAGCTGLDVIEMIRKMKIELNGFDISIDAEMTEDHPKQYTSLKLIYKFEGVNLPKEKIERACQLSFDKYCGVLAMYKKAIPVTYEVYFSS